MLSYKIPLIGINDLRKILMEKGIMNMNYQIFTNDSYGYIPINEEDEKIAKENIEDLEKKIDERLSKKIKKQSSDKIAITLSKKDLKPMKKIPKSMSEHLLGKLNDEEIESLKKSFDIIGDVVILEIPEKLENNKYLIGKAALNFTKRKAIFMKKSAITGLTRTRQLEHIAGEDESKTIHKEHGVQLKLDVKDVYFSPRLATERNRVAMQVENSEKILDMFAGIGPFPLLIAKNKKTEICAVDINEKAIEHMKENILINKLKGTIKPILGDINTIYLEKLKDNDIKFDRIIMNLPGTAYEYLELAISLIDDGGIIHYYEFSSDYNQAIERIEKIANKYNKDFKILETRKVKSSSPGMWHVVVDVKF